MDSAALGEWLGTEVRSMTAPTGGGWSNETWLVDLADGRKVVVRLEPERRSMFPTYDLGRQVQCLRALASVPGVPTPPLIAEDLSGSRFGRPAFVMGFLDGRVPADDRPTFAEAGWLFDADAAEQQQFVTSVLGCLARLHEVPAPFAVPAQSNVAWLDALREIWDFDRGDRWPAVIDDAFAVLSSAVPEPVADVLLWGDARPANLVVASDGFDAVGLLDWELATVGSPEHEITWWLEMNWVRIEGAGLARLPGFPGDDETVAIYERLSGRRLSSLGWYRRVAALRVAVLMHRYLRAMVHADRMSADHRIFGDTVASRRLDVLMAAG